MQTDETLKARARAMRQDPTPAERRMWSLLRGKRFEDVKFTRQAIIGRYIVDFAAPSRDLAIEIDGETHAVQLAYDAERTGFLERQGYRVLRFNNADVMTNIEGVFAAISHALAAPTPPPPRPSPRGGRGKWA